MSSDAEVANYLAQRKAKRSTSRSGGAKFKTFTATAAFIASDSLAEDEDFGEESAPAPLVQAPANPTSSFSTSHSSLQPPTASTLVAGEWIDDENQYSAQPRLMNGGIQMTDLETLVETDYKESKLQVQDDIKKSSQGRSISDEKGLRKESEAPTVPSSTTGSQAVPSVWGKVERPAKLDLRSEEAAAKPVIVSAWGKSSREIPRVVAPKEEIPPAPKAPETKPGIWVPKSKLVAQAQGPSTAPPKIPSPPAVIQRSTAAPPPTISSEGRDKDGLKRSTNAWVPKSRAGS